MYKNEESSINDSPLYIIKKVNELVTGDIVLHPIYRQDGLMLINRYTKLSPYLIQQVNTQLQGGMPVICISDANSLDNFINNSMYSDIVFLNALKNIVLESKKLYKSHISVQAYIDERVVLQPQNLNANTNKIQLLESEEYDRLIKIISSSPLWNSLETKLDSSRLQNRSKKIKDVIINKILTDKSMLNFIVQMKDYDDLLIIHSVNTMCLSILIGLTLELTDKDLIDLSFSALLCNIGCIGLEKKLFFSLVRGMDKEELISQHLRNSIEIISNSPSCRNKSIIDGVLDHHEFYNGNGYPNGKVSKEISLFGRILAIAIGYDDLVSGHFGNEGVFSTKAIDIIWENKDKKYDSEILKIFMFRSSIYKIGQYYVDQYGRGGVIVGFTDYIDAPNKPIVKLANGRYKDYYD